MTVQADRRSGPTGIVGPASFLEWLYSVYPPDRYTHPTVGWGITLVQAALTVLQNNLQINNPLLCTEIRARAFVTATGAAPTLPWRLSIEEAGYPWFNGRWLSTLLSSGELGTVSRFELPTPREIPRETQLSIIADNGVIGGAAAVTVDVLIVGIEPRLRQKPVQRDGQGHAVGV